jgi:signal transduction histidine kinase
MKNDAVSPNDIVSPRAMEDAAIEKSRSNRHELEKLRARNAQLEAALARSASTAEIIAHKTEAEGQRRNVNDAVREALITSLQSDNKQLLVRIDKDALQLATAEDRLRDAEIVKSVASNGLSGMAERILLVNGSCEIVSAPDTGTTVKARIPLGAAIKGANVS